MAGRSVRSPARNCVPVAAVKPPAGPVAEVMSARPGLARAPVSRFRGCRVPHANGRDQLAEQGCGRRGEV